MGKGLIKTKIKHYKSLIKQLKTRENYVLKVNQYKNSVKKDHGNFFRDLINYLLSNAFNIFINSGDFSSALTSSIASLEEFADSLSELLFCPL